MSFSPFKSKRDGMSVAERIMAVLEEQLGVEKTSIQPSDSITDDLGADSLDTVEIVMALEEEFELEISDSDGEKLLNSGGTVQLLTQYIEGRVKNV